MKCISERALHEKKPKPLRRVTLEHNNRTLHSGENIRSARLSYYLKEVTCTWSQELKKGCSGKRKSMAAIASTRGGTRN